MLPCLRALSLGLRMCGARQIRGCYGDTDQCDGTLRTLQIWQGRTLIGLVLPDNLKKRPSQKKISIHSHSFLSVDVFIRPYHQSPF